MVALANFHEFWVSDTRDGLDLHRIRGGDHCFFLVASQSVTARTIMAGLPQTALQQLSLKQTSSLARSFTPDATVT